MNFSLFVAFSTGISRAEKRRKKLKKNDFCAIYPGHKSEIIGGKKNQKKRHAVLGTPDKSKI